MSPVVPLPAENSAAQDGPELGTDEQRLAAEASAASSLGAGEQIEPVLGGGVWPLTDARGSPKTTHEAITTQQSAGCDDSTCMTDLTMCWRDCHYSLKEVLCSQAMAMGVNRGCCRQRCTMCADCRDRAHRLEAGLSLAHATMDSTHGLQAAHDHEAAQSAGSSTPRSRAPSGGAAAVRAQLEQLQPAHMISIPSESLGDKRSSLGALRAQLYAVDAAASIVPVNTPPSDGAFAPPTFAALPDPESAHPDGDGSSRHSARFACSQERAPAASRPAASSSGADRRHSASHSCSANADAPGVPEGESSAELDDGPLSFVSDAAARCGGPQGAPPLLLSCLPNCSTVCCSSSLRCDQGARPYHDAYVNGEGCAWRRVQEAVQRPMPWRRHWTCAGGTASCETALAPSRLANRRCRHALLQKRQVPAQRGRSGSHSIAQRQRGRARTLRKGPRWRARHVLRLRRGRSRGHAGQDLRSCPA